MDSFKSIKASVYDIIERLYDKDQVKPETRIEIIKDTAVGLDAIIDYVGPDGIHKALYGESKRSHYYYYSPFKKSESKTLQ